MSRENQKWYGFHRSSKQKAGIYDIVGGDQGLDAQEEEKEAKRWRRHGPFREQLEILEGRQSQWKEGFICLKVIS